MQTDTTVRDALDDLLQQAMEMSDFIEQQFRRAYPFENKRTLDGWVRDHVILKPAREAMQAAKRALKS